MYRSLGFKDIERYYDNPVRNSGVYGVGSANNEQAQVAPVTLKLQLIVSTSKSRPSTIHDSWQSLAGLLAFASVRRTCSSPAVVPNSLRNQIQNSESTNICQRSLPKLRLARKPLKPPKAKN